MAVSGGPCIPCQRTGLSDREYEEVLKNYLENQRIGKGCPPVAGVNF